MASSSSNESGDLRSIDRLLDELGQAATRGGPPRPFFGELLEQVAFAVQATGASLWLGDGSEGEPQQVAQHGSSHLNPSLFMVDNDLVKPAGARFGVTGTLAISATSASSSIATSRQLRRQTTDSTVALAQAILEGPRVWGWLAVEVATETDARSSKTIQHLLEAFAEIASEYLAGYRSSKLSELDQAIRRRFECSLTLQRCRGIDQVAVEGAEGARIVVDVDRCFVARAGRRPKLLAASGSAMIEQRSTAMRALVEALRELQATSQTVLIDDLSQADRPLGPKTTLYLQEVGVAAWFAIPLPDESRSSGAKAATAAASQPKAHYWLICERFSPVADRIAALEALQFAARQVNAALTRETSIDRIPLWRMQSALAAWCKLDQVAKPLLIAGLLLVGCILAVWLWFRPAENRITVTGELRPTHRAAVFAPVDGQVAQVMVSEGQKIDVDTPLLTILDSDLDLETERLQGERRASLRQLETLRVEMTRLTASGDREARNDAERIAAEMKFVEQEIANAEQLLQQLNAQRQKLEVLSPMAGKVTTWRVDELLALRPLRRGDRLMEIVQEEGPWSLTLWVPDHQMDAALVQESEQKELAIEFSVRTDSSRRFRAILRSIDPATTIDPELGPVVRIECDVQGARDPLFRPGGSVQASIVLGETTWGESLTRETYESWMRYWFR